MALADRLGVFVRLRAAQPSRAILEHGGRQGGQQHGVGTQSMECEHESDPSECARDLREYRSERDSRRVSVRTRAERELRANAIHGPRD